DYQRSKKVGIAEIVLNPLSLTTLEKELQRHAMRAPAEEIVTAAGPGPAPAEPRMRALPPAVAAALRTAPLQSSDKVAQALAA
ncbi:hypothetical protein AAHH80_36020, partial [Burkholderia pseudomallei]